MSGRRIWGITLRHLYNFWHSADRMVDAFYWPILNLVLWGFTIRSIESSGDTNNTWVQAVLFATILWLFVVRVQGDITVNFLEELWNDNISNIFGSPLRLSEWTIGLLLVSVVKLLLTVVLSTVVAMLLYHTNFLGLGWYLIPFTISLTLMGWSLAFFVTGLFFRYGSSIQTISWSGAAALTPFAAVYYPVTQLPEWVQTISYLIPATAIFEGLRSLLNTGTVPTDSLLWSFALNAIYLALALWYFQRSFAIARRNGLAHIK